MQAKKIPRRAIAITRESGVEELAMFYPLLGETEGYTRPVLMDMVRLNPELDGRLRILPVVVDICEMTEEEKAIFRKASAEVEEEP